MPMRYCGARRTIPNSLVRHGWHWLHSKTEVYVSAATAWEIATKVHIGKLAGAATFAAEFPERVRQLGFRELPITVEHGQRAGLLPGTHRGPFDRMLIAQAQAENMPVV